MTHLNKAVHQHSSADSHKLPFVLGLAIPGSIPKVREAEGFPVLRGLLPCSRSHLPASL